MKNIPLLLIPAVLVHVLLLGGYGLTDAWFTATLPSGAIFEVNGGTAALVLGLLTLGGEVFKSTFSSRASLLDHMLSLLLFIVLLLEFLLWSAAGSGVFALLVVMTLVDVITGFAVGMAVARRDLGVLRE